MFFWQKLLHETLVRLYHVEKNVIHNPCRRFLSYFLGNFRLAKQRLSKIAYARESCFSLSIQIYTASWNQEYLHGREKESEKKNPR